MAVATREYLQLVRDSGIRGTRRSAAEARRAILLRSPASELSRDQPLRFRRIGLRAALQRRSILAQGLTCRLRGSPLAGRDRNLENRTVSPVVQIFLDCVRAMARPWANANEHSLSPSPSAPTAHPAGQ